MEVVHLWGGASWHEDGYIVGNRKGLKQLIKIIERALERDDGISYGEAFISDGEGYGLHVISTENTDHLSVPYTWSAAEETREIAVYPWDMVKKDETKKRSPM